MRKLLPLLLFCFFASSIALGQGGKITGVISDADNGETLIGANVVIKGTLIGAATDFEGRFIILNVPPGTYTLEAKYIGYAAVVINEVVVRSGLTTTQNFTLSPESFAGEEVVVTAQQPVVLKDVTSSEARVSSAEIAKLPVQELTDVVKLQAGVNVANDGGIHIRGGRSTEVSYIVDGIRVTDDFNRSQGLRVENQSVEELQIVSGTFNAEYGQAMSGIINISTKSGGNSFKANVNVMGGSFLVENQGLFRDIPYRVADVDPMMQRQFSGSLEGPIIKDKLSFFASFRGFEDQGYLRGRNAYSAQGAWTDTLNLGTSINTSSYRTRFGQSVDLSSPWYSVDTVTVLGNQRVLVNDSGLRDSTIVNLGTAKTYNVLTNFQLTPSKKWKFNLIGSYGQEEFFGYNHGLRLTPYSQAPFERSNYLLNFKTTYTPSATTFITLNVANTYQGESSKLYENWWDPRYLEIGIAPAPGAFRYTTFGTNLNRFDRNTNSLRMKFELSSQVNKQHFVKAGLEMQSDQVFFRNINLQPLENQSDLDAYNIPEDIKPLVNVILPPLETPNHQRFSRNPITLSGFLQDKMEFQDFIINVGVRYDYFNANTRVAADPRDPDITNPSNPFNRWFDTNSNDTIDVAERSNQNRIPREELEKFWWRDVKPKMQLSPRLGIAYTIANGGVVHFSYGYFFQTPTYQALYGNSQILLQQVSGLIGGFGNPDLNPERTTQYEVGFKQEVFKGTALEITGFYRDSRDYVANLGITATYNESISYQKNINLDFSKTRGVTAAINQRLGQQFDFAIDYTFTRVEGSTTNIGALSANAIGAGTISGQQQQDVYNFLIFQGWDRPHILNTRLFFNRKTWGANLTSQYQSGQPYTPGIAFAVRSGQGATQRDLTNVSRMPNTHVINLNAYKNLSFSGYKMNLSLNVFNLLDSRLITGVYGDSGEPNRPFFLPAPDNVDPTFLNTPTNYGQPRRFQVALNISFN